MLVLDWIPVRLRRTGETRVSVPRLLPGDAIAAADAARDGRQWAEAVTLYRRALELDPDNAPIWVQLGHALKESGDIVGGRDAYLVSLRLDGTNSDTALQLGHAEKLLGRFAEAVEWYVRSIVWVPAQSDGYVELRSMGISDADLLQYLWKVDGLTPMVERPAERILWDVSDLSGGDVERKAGASLAWARSIGAELARREAVLLCERDPSGLAWRCCLPTRGGSIATPNMLGLPSNSVLIVPVLDLLALDSDLLIRALGRLSVHERVIAGLYLCDMTWVVDGPSPARNLMLELLAEIAGNSRFILVNTYEESEALRSTLRAMGLGTAVISLSLERTLERTLERRTPGETACGGPDLVLRAPDPAVNERIASVHRAKRPIGSLAFVGTGAVTENSSSISSEGLSLLATARSLVVPSDRPDTAAWIGLALDAGVPVIAERSTRLYSTFGAAVDTYVTLDEGLSVALTQVSPRSAPGAYQVNRFATALQTCFDALAKNPPPLACRPFAFGHFYGLGASGTGLSLRAGLGWTRPQVFGSEIPEEGLNLELLHVPPTMGAIRIAVMVAATDPHKVEFVLEPVDPRGATASSGPLPVAPWCWLTADVQFQRRSADPLLLRLRAQKPDATQVFVCGLIAYPVAADHLWFEFLDRASRGLEPAFRVSRDWSFSCGGNRLTMTCA